MTAIPMNSSSPSDVVMAAAYRSLNVTHCGYLQLLAPLSASIIRQCHQSSLRFQLALIYEYALSVFK